MNKLLNAFIVGFILFGVSSCGLLHQNQGVVGKDSKKQAAITAKLDKIDDDLSQTDQERLTHIAAWARGTEYSLNKATNQEPSVAIAQQINTRVEELANKPELGELKEVYKIIDNLLTNQVNGSKLLEKKDKELIELQAQIKILNDRRLDAEKKRDIIAQNSAAQADQYAATLDHLQGGWGLNAILYGLKSLITHVAIALGIFAVLFIVLRVLAASNPIAASIFSIFEMIGSWIINTVKIILPKSIHFSKLTTKETADGYKDTLKNIIDDVFLLESRQKNVPQLTVTLNDLLSNLQKNLNDDDKARIAEVKTELNWKPSTVVVV